MVDDTCIEYNKKTINTTCADYNKKPGGTCLEYNKDKPVYGSTCTEYNKKTVTDFDNCLVWNWLPGTICNGVEPEGRDNLRTGRGSDV